MLRPKCCRGAILVHDDGAPKLQIRACGFFVLVGPLGGVCLYFERKINALQSDINFFLSSYVLETFKEAIFKN